MLGARARAGGTQRWTRDLPASVVAHLGDWAAPGFEVEPWLEAQLAMAGVPGASLGTPIILKGRG